MATAQTAYLNGTFLPLSEATVSVMDRGFLFGDGVYEAIAVFNKKPFQLSQHFKRLTRNCSAIDIDCPLSANKLTEIAQRLINNNDVAEQQLYLQITRGVHPTRGYTFDHKLQPTVFAFSQEIHVKSFDELIKGGKAITIEDFRWLRCDIKTTSLMANVLMQQQVKQHNALEAILLKNNQVTEGSSSNIFIVSSGRIMTPPLSENILGGTTRQLILDIANQHDIPCQETDISLQQLCDADEVWLASSSSQIQPITHVDTTTIADGKPGPYWKNVFGYYDDYKKTL